MVPVLTMLLSYVLKSNFYSFWCYSWVSNRNFKGTLVGRLLMSQWLCLSLKHVSSTGVAWRSQSQMLVWSWPCFQQLKKVHQQLKKKKKLISPKFTVLMLGSGLILPEQCFSHTLAALGLPALQKSPAVNDQIRATLVWISSNFKIVSILWNNS